MAALGGTFQESYDFSQLGSLPQELSWTNPPPETVLGTEGLKVTGICPNVMIHPYSGIAAYNQTVVSEVCTCC